MKINISRHNLYMVLVSLFLLVFVFLFSFFLLIPSGKEYREKRLALKKETKTYIQYKEFHDKTADDLKTLQGKNRHVIAAFDAIFNPDRFQKLYKNYFTTLQLSKLERLKNVDGFALYEVNTTSNIHSPKNFYDFLDAVNKSDWIIGVNFPINFQRKGEMIESSFTMKVYANNKDKNVTTSGSSTK